MFKACPVQQGPESRSPVVSFFLALARSAVECGRSRDHQHLANIRHSNLTSSSFLPPLLPLLFYSNTDNINSHASVLPIDRRSRRSTVPHCRESVGSTRHSMQ